MSRDEQIEEMANAILYQGDNYDTCCKDDCETIALLIYNKGYRKASEVTREIADFIWEKDIAGTLLPINGRYLSKQEFIEHFEKKYTEKGNEQDG